VVRFLSPEWVTAFNAAVGAVVVAPPGDDAGLAAQGGSFSMGQLVTGGPGEDVGTTLRVGAGRVALEAGADGDADVTVRLAWEDAVALAAGALAPEEAIAAGRVRVRGDLSVLAEARSVLLALQPHLRELGSRTEY